MLTYNIWQCLFFMTCRGTINPISPVNRRTVIAQAHWYYRVSLHPLVASEERIRGTKFCTADACGGAVLFSGHAATIGRRFPILVAYCIAGNSL